MIMPRGFIDLFLFIEEVTHFPLVELRGIEISIFLYLYHYHVSIVNQVLFLVIRSVSFPKYFIEISYRPPSVSLYSDTTQYVSPKMDIPIDESLLLWKGCLSFKQIIRIKCARLKVTFYLNLTPDMNVCIAENESG